MTERDQGFDPIDTPLNTGRPLEQEASPGIDNDELDEDEIDDDELDEDGLDDELDETEAHAEGVITLSVLGRHQRC